MSEITQQKQFSKSAISHPTYFLNNWDIDDDWIKYPPSQHISITVLKLNIFSKDTSNKTSDGEIDNISSNLKANLSNRSGIESVWLEDLGKQINVIIETKNVRNSTLDPIFDARIDVMQKYPYLSFNFELNPVDFEQKLFANKIRRIL